MLDGDAVGKGVRLVQGDGGAFLLAGDHAGRPGSLYAVDLYLGVQVLDGVGHPGDQPAAANGDHHGVGAFQLVQNFQADGPLAGDNLIVIKGVDEGGPSLLLELEGGGVGVVVGPFHQADLCPQLFSGLHLADGGSVGHADQGFDPALGGGHGHTLGVVSGAAGQDAVLLLLLGELADLIVGASEFEAAGFLQVLGF